MEFTLSTVEVINRETGETEYATYMPNRRGNLRFYVARFDEQGKFYSDRNFDKKYKIVKNSKR